MISLKQTFVAAFILFSAFAGAQKLDNALLWKISGNGLTAPSYLYGTIHMTCDASLDAKVLDALDATSRLYLELDMDDPKLQSAMMGGMIMKDGVTMSSLASAEDFAAVDELLKKTTGVSAKMLDNVKPVMVTSMLLPGMFDCAPQATEAVLMQISQEQKEEILGLETVEEQLAVFDAIPYKQQMQELVKTARSGMASDKEELKKMMDIYNRKDITALLEFMHTSENKMYSEHNDVLLTNRNRNWISKIEAAAKAAPTFFGVGAAHLAGEQGVIKLLRKKGYKVEAVK